jgi:hypothetical protein
LTRSFGGRKTNITSSNTKPYVGEEDRMRLALSFVGTLCACAIVLSVSPPAAAQVQTGEIVGKVTDESGGAAAGAVVTLESPALIRSLSATTTASGSYRFPNIPIGTYSMRFELPGFARLVREGVRIDTGFIAEVNAKLTVSPREETLTVSGESPMVNTRATPIASNFTRELLDAIPSARDPWVILEQTPGMVMDRQNVGGNQSGQQSGFVAHGSDRNQMWNIDGATVTDMAAAASPGYFDFDSFEEIQITTGGNDASQDSGGVSINFVTKSGGNTFRGSSRIYLADKAQQSENITPALLAQGAGAGNPLKAVREYGFELGGPIKKDKAWFWGGFSQSDVKVGVIGFLKPGATNATDADNLETDLTTLKNINLKLTYQWAKKHKSSFLYNLGDKARNARGAGPLSPIETTVRQTSPGYMAFLDHQWIASDRLNMNLKATHVDGGFLLDFHSDELATVQPTFDIVTQMNGRSGTQTDNIRPTTEVRLDGNYFLPDLLGGDHATKFGLRYRSTPYQTITKTGGGATARFRNGVPSEANITRDGHTSRGLWEYSAYVNDSFRRGRVTVNLGLRFDFQDDEARAANIAANPILPDRLPALSFKGADSGATFADLSPRLGLTFDARGDGKTVLKTNLARYYGLGIYTAGTISPTGQTTLRYPWNDRNGDRFVQRDELDLTRLLNVSANYNPANPSAVNTPATVDPNLENDITDEFTFSVEHELMNDFAVSLAYMYRHYTNTNDSFRVGLSSSQFVAVPFSPNCGNTTCDQPSYSVTYWQLPFQRPAETIQRNFQGQNRRYHGVEFTARKRFRDRWLMNAGFTWNSTIRHYEGGADVDYQDPTNFLQQDGYPAGTLNARWVAKLSGMYQLPWRMSASAFFNFRDGFPFNRTVLTPSRTGGYGTADVFVRPFASERHEWFRQIDMRVDKTIKAGPTKLIASIDCFNLLNEAIVLDRIGRQNAANANSVTEVLAPRVFRFGLRLQF